MRKLDPWGTRPALGVGGNEARGNKEKGKKKAPKLSNSVCVPPLPLLLDFLRHCSSGARRGKSETLSMRGGGGDANGPRAEINFSI